MAAASSSLSEDRFLCSICLDVFTDPVSTPCGHNFCKNCITTHWDINVHYQCPNCNKVFDTRPELQVNTFVSEMVSYFRQSAQQRASSSEQQAAEPGDVPCDVCTGPKVKALKSCLVTHDVASVKEEYERKKSKLEKTEATIYQMIRERELKIQEFEHSVSISREFADREIADRNHVFTKLKEAIERNQAKVIESTEEKHRMTEKQAEGFIKELEQEISELKKRSSELVQLLLSEDHLDFIQKFPSLDAAPPTKNWTEVKICPPSYEGTVGTAVDQLVEMLTNEMKKLLTEFELKTVQQYAVDVTFDPDTAHPHLILSEDGKQVHDGGVWEDLPENPKRFSHSLFVLGKQLVSSGRFYFEVQVKGKTKWALGVARESVDRKRSLTLSPNSGYWAIWLMNENFYRSSETSVRLPLKSKPEKVGVFVDYDEGLVFFYDVDDAALIYTYTGCSFTEKLHPFFSPCANQDGESSAPLIICPVNPT